MRKFSLMMIAALCAGWALQGFAQHSVTIKGKVNFMFQIYIDNGWKEKQGNEKPFPHIKRIYKPEQFNAKMYKILLV